MKQETIADQGFEHMPLGSATIAILLANCKRAFSTMNFKYPSLQCDNAAAFVALERFETL